MVSEPVLQTDHKKLFFTNLWGVVCAYNLIFELITFCWVDKISCVMWFCSVIWLVPSEPGVRSRQLLPQMLPGSLLPLILREPGNEARLTSQCSTVIYFSHVCVKWSSVSVSPGFSLELYLQMVHDVILAYGPSADPFFRYILMSHRKNLCSHIL